MVNQTQSGFENLPFLQSIKYECVFWDYSLGNMLFISLFSTSKMNHYLCIDLAFYGLPLTVYSDITAHLFQNLLQILRGQIPP